VVCLEADLLDTHDYRRQTSNTCMMHSNDKRTSHGRLIVAAQAEIIAWTYERDCQCSEDVKGCHSDPNRLYADRKDLSWVLSLSCNDTDDLRSLERKRCS
jgi:hypothetical protein